MNHRKWSLLLLTLASLTLEAFGQTPVSVLACDDPWGASAGCNGCNGLRWAAPSGSAAVRSPQYTHWVPWSSLKPTDEVFTSTNVPGSYGSCDTSRRVTVASLTGAPSPAPPLPPPPPPPAVALLTEKPIAFPSLAAPRGKLIRIPAELVQNGEDWLGIWSAQTPTQLYTYTRTFSLGEFIPWLAGEKSNTDAEFAANPGRVIPPGALTAWMDARRAENQWRVTTAANGTTPSRPVYRKFASGLRESAAVSGARVRVALSGQDPEPCNWARLSDSAGKATAYHSVKGRPNVATTDPGDVLGDVYALCSVTPPPSGAVN